MREKIKVTRRDKGESKGEGGNQASNHTLKLKKKKSNPKEGSAKEFSNYHITALISHASRVMLKILQAGLQ